MANQIWEFREFPGPKPNGEDNAVIYLNEPARQGRGEATATLRNDGSVGLFYLVPGDLGTSTAPTWESREFPSPDGEKSAVIFLNEPARQGPGEATATLRNDGSAGLIYFEPGSLGTATSPSWLIAEFASAQEAANFLNADPKQGAGEASATLRDNGTAGLLYLEPGSLGTETSPTWLTAEFPSIQAAVDFLNADPRQGPGEASATPRSNGTVGLIFLEPGSLGAATSPTWLSAEFPNVQDAVNFLNEPPQQTAGEVSAFIRNDGTTVLVFLEP